MYRLVPRVAGLPRWSDADGAGPRETGTAAPDGAAADDVAEEPGHHRVEVHLHGGGQGYNVMGYTYGQLVDDLLDQYEQHLELLRLEREATP
ncbi:hypothetical protein [Pseudonocardia sp. HH130630-07]|uniref:hypothetical protein n=1 Tax=Pseudonocardia sp. HH130630-07 TaxID=1690815 RepID=UPI000814E8BA|nr:hypothetical protein AFB00_29210 [Pseudonocardia sp. HH130630-07]